VEVEERNRRAFGVCSGVDYEALRRGIKKNGAQSRRYWTLQGVLIVAFAFCFSFVGLF
jgi:hypothetical protein